MAVHIRLGSGIALALLVGCEAPHAAPPDAGAAIDGAVVDDRRIEISVHGFTPAGPMDAFHYAVALFTDPCFACAYELELTQTRYFDQLPWIYVTLAPGAPGDPATGYATVFTWQGEDRGFQSSAETSHVAFRPARARSDGANLLDGRRLVGQLSITGAGWQVELDVDLPAKSNNGIDRRASRSSLPPVGLATSPLPEPER